MRRFFFALFAITFAAHVPFGLGLWWLLERAGVPYAWVIAAVVASGLGSMVRGRVRRARDDAPMPLWRITFIEEPYYAHWGGCIGALILFVPALLGSQLFRLVGSPPPIGAVALACYLAGAALASWGVFFRRRLVGVRTIEVPIAGLGAAFDGYRIAQLSDLHIGGLWPKQRAARWVRKVEKLAPDLVVLTGDYVTSGTAFHRDIAETVSAMQGRDGTIAVMGNHDYFGDGEPLVTLLRAGGVSVLRNENIEIARGEDRITVVGVDDTWTKRADVERSVAGRDASLPMVALAHDPKLFPELAAKGAALVLSGHTHWGQVAIPFLPTHFNLSRLSYRYHAGLYREGDAVLYVHPGLGTTGPPIRVGAAPEIAVFVLRAA